ncbi:MAG TPA: response regulator [Candidatus Limiplasma sp.]|nr:response regulator [Candidatus Limiplasma sp.]HRX08012.1 response regulator [Candidatus Limiplasma sp.]
MYRVLIVDDEAIICKGLRNTIEWDSLGLEICGEAHNGQDALALIREMQPNILITDIRMPVMDGLTLIQTIRAHHLPIKIIILSGYSDYAFLKDAIRLGVDGYLLKPIDHDELIANLSDLVNSIESEMLHSPQLYQGIELLRSNTLNRLVTHTIGLREFEEKAAFLEITLEGPCFLCAACALEQADGAAAGYDDQTILTVLRIIHQAATEWNGLAFLDVNDRIVLLLGGDHQDSLRCAANAVMEATAGRVRERFARQLTCGWGTAVASVEEIWKSYAAATACFGGPATLLEADALEGRGNALVDRALLQIAEHYREAISLKQLAGIMEINTSYLGQLFKKTTGESFTGYVNQYRIQKAKELLAQTTLKVYEVAQEVGFTDYHYFLIIFKKLTGSTPTDTRI